MLRTDLGENYRLMMSRRFTLWDQQVRRSTVRPFLMSDCDSYLNSCSENFLVRWDSMGMPKEIEKLNNLPALFTVTES